jgi:1-pyrroline-5-carboxylate dehydrogenase
MSSIPWATMDPKALGASAEPYAVPNIVDGKFTTAKNTMEIVHPMDRYAHPIFTIPDTQADEIQPFVDSLRKVSKSGLHNPLKNPERYLHYGEISRQVRVLLLYLYSVKYQPLCLPAHPLF